MPWAPPVQSTTEYLYVILSMLYDLIAYNYVYMYVYIYIYIHIYIYIYIYLWPPAWPPPWGQYNYYYYYIICSKLYHILLPRALGIC